MNIERIEQISDNIEKIIDKENKSSQKMNNLEQIVSKMKNNIEEMQMNNNQSTHEMKSAFHNFVRSGVASELITKSLSGANGEAGVIITPSLSKQIINAVHSKSIMRQIASVENISTRALDIISEDGRFDSGWVSESQARAETNTPKLTKKTIFAHEIYAQPKATQSLLNDAEINIEKWLIERLADSFTRLENEAFINGDGNNKPVGLLTNNKIKTLDAGKNVSAGLLLALINSVPENYRANISFLMNRSTLAAIQSLTDDTGRFIWQQSLADPLKQTIFGVPVHVCAEMPDMGADSLSIAVGDFKAAYKIVDRSGINLLRDPYTDKPFVRFYAVKRVGGDVVDPKSVVFAKFSA